MPIAHRSAGSQYPSFARSIGGAALMLLAATALVLLSGSVSSTSVSGEDTGSAPGWKNLTQQYAMSVARVAEATLANCAALNRTSPDTVPPEQIARLKREVELAQYRAQTLGSGKPLDASTTFEWLADAAARNAEGRYARLVEETRAGINHTQEEMSLAKAKVEFAAARLALAKQLGSQPADVRLQWQMELLLDELTNLRWTVYQPNPQ